MVETVSIENVWSSRQTAMFTERCEIYVQLRNCSENPITIEKVECNFDCEAGIEPYIPHQTPLLSLDPRHLSSPPIRIEFPVDIALKGGTNVYSLTIHFNDGLPKSMKFTPAKSIIFCPLSPGEHQFFISHKDPENTDLALALAEFLRKLGFKGFLSEKNPTPGLDLWKEKIPPVIKCSIALVVLWTVEGANSPDSIYREIEIAKDAHKRVMVARDAGVASLDKIDRDIEYFPCVSPMSKDSLKKFAYAIEGMYQRGEFGAR